MFSWQGGGRGGLGAAAGEPLETAAGATKPRELPHGPTSGRHLLGKGSASRSRASHLSSVVDVVVQCWTGIFFFINISQLGLSLGQDPEF